MSDERKALRAAVRAAITGHGTTRQWVSQRADGAPANLALWTTLAHEVGLAGLLIPEHLGGAGGDVADVAEAFEAIGQVLSPVPLLSTVGLAVPMLLACADNAPATGLLRRIGSAATIVAVASYELGAHWYADPQTTVATHRGASALTGRKDFVLDGALAEVLLVSAATSQGPGLFAVTSGARVTELDSLDVTRGLARVEFDHTPAALLAVGAAARDAIHLGLDIGTALLCCELVGAAQHCLDQAVSYAKQRIQFGRPIGSFQAVKHTLVGVLLEVELARSACNLAVAAADAWRKCPTTDNRTRLAVAASSAKAVCGEAFMVAAEETLHVFGGIGFTWEHDAHLYYRRAKFGQLYLDMADSHRERVARLTGLGAAAR